MNQEIDILAVRKGDIVRFKSYSLRVESEPARGKGSITLRGRINVQGCPIVKRQFLGGRTVTVERTP